MFYIAYPWFSPSYLAGGPTQSLLHLVQQINQEIDITVLCSAKEIDGTNLAVEPNQFTPFSTNTRIWYSGQSNIIAWCRFINKQPAGIWYINGIYSLRFALLPLWLGKGKKIICPRGMLDTGSLHQKKRKKQFFLYFFQWIAKRRKVLFHATSAVEAKNIERIMGRDVAIKLIPNFPKLLLPLEVPQKKLGQLTLISIALIGPMKNHLLVLQALEKCSSQIEYLIYGPIADPAYWNECLQQMSRLPPNIRVQYRGVIHPDQISTALSDAQVYIQPSNSENFGHSLVEAMSAGRPIITSNHTPWNNLEQAKAGMNVDHTSMASIRAAIDYFALMDEQSFQGWSNGAHEYAYRAFDIASIKNDYLALFHH